MIEEYNTVEKRCNMFYKNKYIDNMYDRIEVEKQIIETIFNDYKDFIPDTFIHLDFVYSGLLDEGYTKAPAAVTTIDTIQAFIDTIDGAVNHIIVDCAGIHVVNTIEEATTCWEILFCQCALLILHEMTHCAEILNMYLMYNPEYVSIAENTSNLLAMNIVQQDMNIDENILNILIKAQFGNTAMFPVVASIFNDTPYNLANYYYETLKESFQVFGNYYNTDGKFILSRLQDLIYNRDHKNIIILDHINNPDNQNGLVIKVDGEFLYPSQYYANFIYKLMHILRNNIICEDCFLYIEDTITINSVEYECIAVTGTFLYKPFIKENFMSYLGLSDVYNKDIY